VRDVSGVQTDLLPERGSRRQALRRFESSSMPSFDARRACAPQRNRESMWSSRDVATRIGFWCAATKRGSLPAFCPAKWRSLVSRYHSILVLALIAGCVHDKANPPRPAPPPSSATFVEIPAKEAESHAGGHQNPSTGGGMWDPVHRPVSSQPQPAVRSLTAAERERAISVAREYLYKDDPEPGEIEYKVHRTEDGYSVFVQFAWVPGGHCLLRISSEWEVTELIPGA
jgi:hypothetical protein